MIKQMLAAPSAFSMWLGRVGWCKGRLGIHVYPAVADAHGVDVAVGVSGPCLFGRDHQITGAIIDDGAAYCGCSGVGLQNGELVV